MNSQAKLNILTEVRGRIAILSLNRPQVLNALNDALMDELVTNLLRLDSDPNISCFIITGGDKVFAAGVDVAEMSDLQPMDLYQNQLITGQWKRLQQIRKPMIAAVAGYALGGGCELALACDIIIAADNAKFGFPEIKLGTIPGSGGTQRLPRAISKAKAMQMCLTASTIDADAAEKSGLVSQVVPHEQLMEKALEVAATIAKYSLPIVMMMKEAINKSFETTLTNGIDFERNLFQTTFSTHDQKEGMEAFIHKRLPIFKNS